MSTRLKPYPAYKDSGVEWLGKIPEHWDSWKLAHAFAEIGSGTTPNTGNESYFDGDIPWVTTSELRERVITETETKLTKQAVLDHSALKIYHPDTLLFAMYGATIGRLGILGISACVNQACCALGRSKVIRTKYAYYALWATRQQLISMASGGGQPNVNQEKLRAFRLPVPLTDEQQSIAAFLDRETAKIDALVAKKERLIELLQEKRMALISHAVTQGLNPNVPKKDSGIPWLGRMPRHWITQELRRLVRKGTTITYGIVQAGPDVEGGIPYIRTSDMSGNELPISGYLRTSREIDDAYRRSKVTTGDIVVAIRASVGKALLVPAHLDGANLTQGTAKISTGPLLHRRYLFYVLNASPSQQRFSALAKGATFREITLDMLRRFSVPVPPLPEQEAVAAFLDAQTAKLDALTAKVRTAIERLQEYRTALISAAVTGQIDVRKETAT